MRGKKRMLQKAEVSPRPERLLACRQVTEMTSLSRRSIYKLVSERILAKPVVISKGRVAWRESDIQEFIRSRVAR
jgi:predicted DNA-binding transcriptional regulator AlpA